MTKENRGFLDEFGETFSKTMKDIAERTGNIYEEQKLRSRITTEERQIEKLKANIGNMIYARFSEGENVDESVLELCEQIRGHVDSIDALREEIVSRKGLRTCPVCRKEVSATALFCPNCGAQMPVPEPKKVEEKESGPSMSNQEKEAVDGIFADSYLETAPEKGSGDSEEAKSGENDPFKGGEA